MANQLQPREFGLTTWNEDDSTQQVVWNPENSFSIPATTLCLQNPSSSSSLPASEMDTCTEIFNLLNEQSPQPTRPLQALTTNIRAPMPVTVMEDGESSRAKRKFKELDSPQTQSQEKGCGGMSKRKQDDLQPMTPESTEMHNKRERRSRERIAEKIKALEEVIPHCHKKGRALVLDQATQYIKILQRQIQMMAMERSAIYHSSLMQPANYPSFQVPWMSVNPIIGTGVYSGSCAYLMPQPTSIPVIQTSSGSLPPLASAAVQLPQIHGSGGFPHTQMQIPLHPFQPPPAAAPSSISQPMFLPALSATLERSTHCECSSQIAPRNLADGPGRTEGPGIPIIPMPSGSLKLSTSVAENLAQICGSGVLSQAQMQIPFNPVLVQQFPRAPPTPIMQPMIFPAESAVLDHPIQGATSSQAAPRNIDDSYHKTILTK